MNKICLIGNSGSNKYPYNGQCAKVNLYKKKIVDEGFDLDFIDLFYFRAHPFRIFISICKSVKHCQRIVLLTAQNGAKILIPFINLINKKRKPFIFPLIGINILHKYIDKLSTFDQRAFLLENKYLEKPSHKDVKNFKKISLILAENVVVANALKNFFGLSNVEVLENFRDCSILTKKISFDKKLKVIFLSRVCKDKGILDLLDCITKLQKENVEICLDIYGQNGLNKLDNEKFYSLLNKNIVYHGPISCNDVVSTINNYDCFIFPTKFINEGTPGVISESFIAGVPIISSNFVQAYTILNDKHDSLIYEQSNNLELCKYLKKIYFDREYLGFLTKNAHKIALKFTYDFCRDKFLEYVCGKNERS